MVQQKASQGDGLLVADPALVPLLILAAKLFTKSL